MIYTSGHRRLFFGAAGAFLVVAATFWIASCSSSKSSTSPQTYVGAGSQFSISIDSPAAGQFTLTHAPAVGGTSDLTINGTYAARSTGFLVLTVTSVTGSGSGGVTAPSVGDTAYGLNIPGFVFFLKPMGSNAPLIPMVPSGGCPPSSLALNWMLVKPQTASTWTSSTDTYGTFSYDTTTGAANVSSKYEYSGTSDGSMSVGSGGCSGNSGILSITGGSGNGADLFLTPSGGAIVHTGTSNESTGGDQIIFAMPTPASAISIPSLAGNYAGIVFQNASGGRNFPVIVTLAASSNTVSGTGSQLTDPADASSTAGSVSLTLNATPGGLNGFATGTITSNGGPQTLVCEAQPNAGSTTNTVLACVGADGSSNFFSVILTSH